MSVEVKKLGIIDTYRKTLPKPEVGHRLSYYLFGDDVSKSVILGNVRGKKDVVIHGARAMNIQVPFFLTRPTTDWDLVVTRDAPKIARSIEAHLDRMFGANLFYVKVIAIDGRKPKIVYRVKSRVDGVVADVTQEQILPPHVVIGNVAYETLQSLRRKKIDILRNPRLSFRWEKAKKDIEIIDRAIELIKMRNFVWRLLR
jgi:hypothetical protein